MKKYLVRLKDKITNFNSKVVTARKPNAVDPVLASRLMMYSMDRFNHGGYILNQSTHSYR